MSHFVLQLMVLLSLLSKTLLLKVCRPLNISVSKFENETEKKRLYEFVVIIILTLSNV